MKPEEILISLLAFALLVLGSALDWILG